MISRYLLYIPNVHAITKEYSKLVVPSARTKLDFLDVASVRCYTSVTKKETKNRTDKRNYPSCMQAHIKFLNTQKQTVNVSHINKMQVILTSF